MDWLRRWRLCLFAFFFLAAPLVGCDCEPTDLGGVSELVALPKNLSYEAQQGETQTKKVVIQAKVGSVLISSIKLVRGAPEYKIDPDSLPAMPKALTEGQSITLSVIYKAPSGDAISGLIEVLSDASTPGDGKLEIRMLAQVNQQQLVFEPNPVDFGEVQRGKSKIIEVIGRNDGRAAIQLNAVKWLDKSSKGYTFPDGLPTAPKELKPGESFKFKVQYEPTTAQVDEGQMDFTCEGNCSPADADPTRRKDPYPLRFSGVLAAPNIEVTPLKIDFGFVPSGTTETKNVKIANKGTAPLLISKISLQAQSSGSFIVPRLLDVTINPGESKDLPVKFNPTTGSKHQGAIEIASNDPGKPLVIVQLFGQVSAPNIEVTPRLLDFGKAPVAKTLGFTIANSGDRPLEVKGIVLMPGTSAEYKIDLTGITFPWTLTPNKFQAIQVTYTPANAGDDIGRIQINSNDPDEPNVEVELKATGSSIPECDLAPAPTRLNFGLSVIGKAKVIPVKWTNQGGKDCQVSTMQIGTDKGGFPFPYNGPDVYHITNIPAACTGKDGNYTCNPPLDIKPGNSILTDISFLPLSEKQTNPLQQPNFTGWLDLVTNGNPSKRRVLLDGLATKACIEVVPDNLDFGLITVNCSSQKEKVLVYNTCAQGVTVTKIDFSTAGTNGFRIVQAQAVPFTIPTGQSAEIELAYRAAAPPQKQNAVLEIVHSITQQSPLSVPMIAEGTLTSEQTDKFKQSKSPKVDILFVIDNSCSMGDDQQSLANNFGSFIKWATTLKVDFQLAVTTTDIGNNPFGSQTTPGELIGPPNVKFLTSSTPNLEAEFQQRVKVGTGGSAQEAGLEGAKLALSHPLITTGANKGFLRTDASLSIIAVSDEADQSPNTAQFYINFFKNIKGFKNPDLFRFNIVVGIDEQTLQPQCPAGGTPTASSSGRYLAVAQASRGVIASICNANWGQTLSRIGAVTFGLKRQFFLSRYADPKTIVVKVNGVVVAKGATTWDYSTQDNSVEFTTAPDAGADIEITYKAICF